jgi:hypothetical protein
LESLPKREKAQSHEKSQNNAVRTPSRLHALLGNHESARTLAIKKAQSHTDKLVP